LKGWTLQATQLQPATIASYPCDVRLPARLEPAGPAGRYRIDVSGTAPGGGGDLVTAFAVTTTSAGPMPAPRASLGAFYDHDGRPDNYGTFEFGIDHLRRTPREATAKLTITGQDGRATYELPWNKDECRPKGEVRFRAEVPNERVSRAVGREPYTIGIELELDGRRHTASVVWPRDVTDEWLVPTFSPPLR
jgi:hypothetical protein